jgi:DNA (cytosine-5)-methyltransferase 1
MTNKCAWFLSDLKKVPLNGIKVFSTFACGGGSTMGYKLAGCEVIGANDIDPEMAYHYKLNHNPKYYFLMPIRELLTTKLPQELFELDILDGSPPCSTFSTAGSREKSWGKEKHFREGQAKQVLSDLFFDFLDVAEYLKPKVIIAENVKGMILGNAKGYTKMVMARLKEIGYKPQLFLVNAADCGVPQKRERVFFCAVRNDVSDKKLILNPKHQWISAGDAVSDLQVLTKEEIEETKPTDTDFRFWDKTKVGGNYRDACFKENGKKSFFSHIKFNQYLPASTLTSQYDKFNHWSVMRSFTLREIKRFGSFPDDYKAKTENIGKYMIGMSVPPKMTYEVAKAVCSQWLGVNYG